MAGGSSETRSAGRPFLGAWEQLPQPCHRSSSLPFIYIPEKKPATAASSSCRQWLRSWAPSLCPQPCGSARGPPRPWQRDGRWRSWPHARCQHCTTGALMPRVRGARPWPTAQPYLQQLPPPRPPLPAGIFSSRLFFLAFHGVLWPVTPPAAPLGYSWQERPCISRGSIHPRSAGTPCPARCLPVPGPCLVSQHVCQGRHVSGTVHVKLCCARRNRPRSRCWARDFPAPRPTAAGRKSVAPLQWDFVP